MVKNLMKTPLTAILFAALLNFSTAFMPFSQGYKEALHAYTTPLLGYVFMIVYGLCISIVFAVVFSSVMAKNLRAALFTAITMVFAGCVAPMLPQLKFGEPAKVMTFSDSLFRIVGSAVSVLLISAVFGLVMKTIQPPPPPAHPSKTPNKVPDKYKFKKIDLATKLIVLPLIYCVIYFVIWYFLLWRGEAARVYYSGVPDPSTFTQAIVAILLNDVMQVPITLLKGFVYTVALIPLLILLKDKRAKFIIASVLTFLFVALSMLVPNPLMPDAVRMQHLIQYAVEAVVFGALASFMLHLSVNRIVQAQPAPAASAKKSAKAATEEKPAE